MYESQALLYTYIRDLKEAVVNEQQISIPKSPFLSEFSRPLTSITLNPIKNGRGGGGGGDVFHHPRGFLPITLEVIKLLTRNLVTFPKI